MRGRGKTPWVGAALGGVGAGIDFAAMRSFGVVIVRGDTDVFWLVCAFFVVSFAAFGWTIGRLIDERRAVRDQRAQIQRQLDALEHQGAALAAAEHLAALGGLAAGVAHEVRNPLGVIRSSASLILEDVDPELPDAARAASFIRDEVDRLDDFVTELLAYARPLTPRLHPVELEQLVRAATESGRDLLGGTRVCTVGSVSVDADAALIVPVMTSLLANAAQAGASSVEVHGQRTDTGTEILLVDDGPGFDEVARSRAFEPFYTTRAQGTGLGLAMAARVVEAHGGRIGLAGVDRGATIRIHLPEGGRNG